MLAFTDILFGLLVFVIITVIAAVLFLAWLTIVIVRGVMRAGASVVRAALPDPPPPRPLPGRTCEYARCKAVNAQNARFCRRCGRELRAPAEQVTVRRAALL